MDGGNIKKHGRAVEGPSQPPPSFMLDPDLSTKVKDINQLVQVADFHQSADDTIAATNVLKQALGKAKETCAPSAQIADLEIRISDCLRLRGELSEAIDHIDNAKEHLAGNVNCTLMGKVFFHEGMIFLKQGDYIQAERTCLAGYELLRESDEHIETGLLELTLGAVYMRMGRMLECREFYESALYSFRRKNHKEGIARALNNLGIILKNGQDWKKAKEYLTRALTVSEEIGNYAHVAVHCKNLGILFAKLCQWEAGEECLARTISINRELGNAYSLASALLARGILRRRRNQLSLAKADYKEAREFCETNTYKRELVLCWEFEGELFADTGQLEKARSYLRQGLVLAEKMAPRGDLIPEITRRLAEVSLTAGDLALARKEAVMAYRGACGVGDMIEAGAALRILGSVYSQQRKDEIAPRILDAACEMLSQTSDRFELAKAQKAYANHLSKNGETNLAAAIEYLQKSTRFFASVGLTEWAVETLAELSEAKALHGDLKGAQRDIIRGQKLAEQTGKDDLCQRVHQALEVIENRSAELTLAISSAGEITEWRKCITTGNTSKESLQNLIQLVTDRLESKRAFLACETPNVVSMIGLDEATAKAIKAVIEPFINEKDIILTADISLDPRFAKYKNDIFSGVESFIGIAVHLPVGRGLIYLDRYCAAQKPYSLADLRVITALASLLGAGLAKLEQEDDKPPVATSSESPRTRPFADYLTTDSGILRSFTQLELVSSSAANILVLGETGTGKGLLTRCIHQASPRATGPFVHVNCAAIPETLLESELFGHEAGSFTGARKGKRGLFEEAEGGTIFLDEISRTSLTVQAKLLHALDTKEIRRVGSNRAKAIDVRVICASNADLHSAIDKRSFLEDLYYRLSDFSVSLPPLRKRRDDIPLLWDHFFDRVCNEMNRHPEPIGDSVRELLYRHEWRGNIRELIQIVRRLIALSGNGEVIGIELLPIEIRRLVDKVETITTGNAVDDAQNELHDSEGNGASRNLRAEVSLLEKRMISEALHDTKWNRSTTARMLGISYPSLLAKIKNFNLRP